jgi:Sec-independent protein translocase protein TatA
MTGNLSEEEDKYLGHIIRELKMNFVEENNKPEEPDSSESVEEKSKDKNDLESETDKTDGKTEDETKDKED